MRPDLVTPARRVVAVLLCALAALASRTHAQDRTAKEDASATVSAETPVELVQDEVQALKSLEGDLVTLSGRVAELWADEGNRPAIRKLVEDDESSATLITAIGRLLANEKVRPSIPQFVRVLAVRDLTLTELDGLFGYVVMPFHSAESLFGELDAAVTGTELDDAQLARVFDVYVQIVQRTRDKKRDATDRYDAVDRLLKLTPHVDDGGREILLATLARLCGNVISFEAVEPWERWLAALTGNRTDRSLSMADIYLDLWKRSREEVEGLRNERRDLAREIITRMRNAPEPEPPVDYLVDGDPDVRKTALLAIQAMSTELSAEARTPAITALVGLLESQRPAAVHVDLINASGALGHAATEADRRALVTALFSADVPTNPAMASVVVRAVGEIGLVDREGRLLDLYQAAKGEGPGWARVRADLVKVAQADDRGVDLVTAGLSDDSAEVREAAAVVLIRLRDRLGDRVAETVETLATKAGAEKAVGPRRRMLESVLALAGENVGQLSAEGLRGVIRAFAFEGDDAKRVALGIVAAALGDEGLEAEVRTELESQLAAALNGQSSPAVRAATVDAITGSPSTSALDVLEAWLVEPRPRTEVWERGKAALLTARANDAAACWKIAESLAGWSTDAPWSAAVDFGARAIATVAVATDHPLAANLPAMRDTLALWRSRTDDPDSWALAVKHVNGRVTATPNAAKLRLTRADLLTRLAAQSPADAARHRAGAVVDLEFVLGPDAVGLRDEDRPGVLRRLAARRLELGRTKQALAALEQLGELAGALTDEDLMLGARARIVDRAFDRSPALADLGKISTESGARLGDSLHLARAAAILLDSDVATHEEAAAHLARVTESDAPLAVELAALFERSRATGAALGRVVEGQGTNEDRAALSTDADLCLLWAIASLTPGTGPERGRALLEILREAVGAEVLGDLVWPDEANGQAASAVGAELRKLWRARPAPQKIATVFLNGG